VVARFSFESFVEALWKSNGDYAGCFVFAATCFSGSQAGDHLLDLGEFSRLLEEDVFLLGWKNGPSGSFDSQGFPEESDPIRLLVKERFGDL
jgi:hypothetical protein